MESQLRNRVRHLGCAATLVACTITPAATGKPQKVLVQPPLAFERNEGQVPGRARFVARGNRYAVAIGSDRAVISTEDSQHRPARIEMRLDGANPDAGFDPLEQLGGKVNYLLGTDRSRWRHGIATYARVRQAGVYPGIDLVYYGAGDRLEYDFNVAPGADPNMIRLRFGGADRIHVNQQGDLVLRVRDRELIEHRPAIYQDTNGRRTEISGGYVVGRDGSVSFRIAPYDRTKLLVIDPILGYSTLLGGAQNDYGTAVAVDAAGNAYVAGYTTSADFPTKGAAQSTFPAKNAVFVTKIAPDGKSFVYSTYLGGSGDNVVKAIALDTAGNAYVAGFTTSTDFPVLNAFQRAFGGGSNDAFVTKIDATGSKLLYSTYLGGGGADQALAIAVDSAGAAYVGGATRSTDFPLKSPLQSSLKVTFSQDRDGFVTKLDPTGSALVYSTYLGGQGDDWVVGIGVDSSGAAIVGGNTEVNGFPLTANKLPSEADAPTAFVTRFAPDGRSLLFSTLLGNATGLFDQDTAIAMKADANGIAYLTGITDSADFPVTAGALQSLPMQSLFTKTQYSPWVVKVDTVNAKRVYSTFLGVDEQPDAIAYDASGDAYVLMSTTSINPTLPLKEPLVLSGNRTATLTVLNPTGSDVIYSTYVNTGEVTGYGVAVDSRGSAYVTTANNTAKTVLVTPGSAQTTGGGNTDAGLIKFFLDTAAPAVRVDAVVNAAGYQGAPVAPGEIVAIYGSGFGSETLEELQIGPDQLVTNTLGGVQVLFDGNPAPLVYVAKNQLSAVVPFKLAGSFTTVQVVSNGVKSGPVYVPVQPFSPALFTMNASGTGQAAAQNEDLTVNSPSNPAKRGSVIVLYGNGGGALSPTPTNGSVTGTSLSNIVPQLNYMYVSFNGHQGKIEYAGSAPYLVAGVNQINVRIPADAPTGDAVPVTFHIDTYDSNTVTVAIK